MKRKHADIGSRQTNQEPKSPNTPTYYSHPEVDQILRSLHPDEYERQSVQVVLKAIVAMQHFKATRKESDEYLEPESVQEHCWTPAEFYAHILTRTGYVRVMRDLVNNKILHGSSFTSPLGRHPTYRLANPSWLHGYNLVPVTIPTLQKKIQTYAAFKSRHIPSVMQKVVPHVIENFCFIDLSRLDFMGYWRWRFLNIYEPKQRRQLAQNPRKKGLTWREYERRGYEILSSIKAWNCADDAEKMQWFKVCSFGHRLHHPFTYWPSEIRAYILDRRGNPIQLIEYDLANSQPFIFANSLLWPRADYSKDMNKSRYYRLRDSEFVKRVEEHLIYEDMAAKLGITRDDAKVELLHWMYSMADSNAQKCFEKYYGDVGVEAGRIKSQTTDVYGNRYGYLSRHKQLPKMMQRAESAMFKRIWMRLIDKGYVILPIHDAVYCANVKSKTKKNDIKRTLKREIKCHMKLRHYIKEKEVVRELETILNDYSDVMLSTEECMEYIHC